MLIDERQSDDEILDVVDELLGGGRNGLIFLLVSIVRKIINERNDELLGFSLELL